MNKNSSNTQAYLSHRDALVHYATPITGCRARAEDIVQEAFLKVIPHESTQKNAIAYLYRTVRNLAIDMVRRSVMEDKHQDVEKISWLEPNGISDPEQMNSQRDELQSIAQAIAALPSSERHAIEMHRLNGQSMAEIAQELGVSIATVHRLIRSALATISGALDESAS